MVAAARAAYVQRASRFDSIRFAVSASHSRFEADSIRFDYCDVARRFDSIREFTLAVSIPFDIAAQFDMVDSWPSTRGNVCWWAQRRSSHKWIPQTRMAWQQL